MVCNIERLGIGLGNEAVFTNVSILEYSILAENMLCYSHNKSLRYLHFSGVDTGRGKGAAAPQM